MMKKILNLIAIFLATGAVAQNATKINESFTAITWMSRDEGMSIEAYFVLGNDIYAGVGEARTDDLVSFFKYSITGNTWTKLKDFPGDKRRYGAISFSCNGKGYFGLGGYGAQNDDIWEYNPVGDSWTKFTDFPDGKIEHAAVFVIDNYAYIGSGVLDYEGERSRSDFWKLNLNTKAWTKIASTPQPLERASSFAVGGKGYLAGGAYIWSSIYRTQILEYDPQTDTWEVKLTDTDKLHFREGRAAVIDNDAYLFYGDECKVAKYTPADNTLVSLSDFIGLGEERYSALCVAHQGSIYYGLGTYNDKNWYAQYPRDLWKLAINPTGIHETRPNGSIMAGFDGNSRSIWIRSDHPVNRVEIYDATGRKVLESQASQSINVSHLPKGFYFVFVQVGQEHSIQKVLINN
jgi:hypothetical protein